MKSIIFSAKQVDQKEAGSNFSLAGMKFLTSPSDVKNKEISSSTAAVEESQISYNCAPKAKKVANFE